MLVKIGCCGYPVSRPKYFETFRVVEIQSTFYSLPKISTVRRWREEAPVGFEYIVKGFQGVTHPSTSPTWRRFRGELPGNRENYGLLKNTEEVRWSWSKTIEICRELGSDKVLIQLPPKCEVTNEALDVLKEFAIKGVIILFEPRHPSWFQEDVLNFIRQNSIILCVDPFKNSPVKTGNIHYWRLHGRDGYRYGYKYTDEDLDELVNLINMHGDVDTVYVMFNNKFMFEDALRLRELLRENGFEAI